MKILRWLVLSLVLAFTPQRTNAGCYESCITGWFPYDCAMICAQADAMSNASIKGALLGCIFGAAAGIAFMANFPRLPYRRFIASCVALSCFIAAQIIL